MKVAEVVRDLWRRERDRGLSAGEKRMLAKARQILVSELALAEHTNEDKAEALLDEVARLLISQNSNTDKAPGPWSGSLSVSLADGVPDAVLADFRAAKADGCPHVGVRPVTDTVKVLHGDVVGETLDRSDLWQVVGPVDEPAEGVTDPVYVGVVPRPRPRPRER